MKRIGNVTSATDRFESHVINRNVARELASNCCLEHYDVTGLRWEMDSRCEPRSDRVLLADALPQHDVRGGSDAEHWKSVDVVTEHVIRKRQAELANFQLNRKLKPAT